LAAGVMPQAAQVQANIDSLMSSNPKVKNLNAAAMVEQSFVRKAQLATKTK
jgi:hypothetical protein